MNDSNPASYVKTQLAYNGINWREYDLTLSAYAYSIGPYGLEVLQGCPIPPQDDKDNSKYAQWHRADRLVTFYITSTQTDATRHILLGMPVAPGVATLLYKKLSDHNTGIAKTNIIELVDNLLAFEQSTGLQEFISEITYKKNQLTKAITESKLNIVDVLACKVLLDRTAAIYKPITNAIKVGSDSDDFEKCKTKLLEMGLPMERASKGTGDMAYSAAASNGQCNYCHKKGHTEDQCYSKHPDKIPNRASNHKKSDKPKSGKKANNSKNSTESTSTSAFTWKAEAKISTTVTELQLQPDEILFDLDSGATEHFVNSLNGCTNFNPTDKIRVEVADNRHITTDGSALLAGKKVHLSQHFGSNLMSINQLDNNGAKVTFHNGTVQIKYPNGKVAEGLKVNGMYKVKLSVPSTSVKKTVTLTESSSLQEKLKFLHHKLGIHLIPDYVN